MAVSEVEQLIHVHLNMMRKDTQQSVNILMVKLLSIFIKVIQRIKVSLIFLDYVENFRLIFYLKYLFLQKFH